MSEAMAEVLEYFAWGYEHNNTPEMCLKAREALATHEREREGTIEVDKIKLSHIVGRIKCRTDWKNCPLYDECPHNYGSRACTTKIYAYLTGKGGEDE